MTSFENQKSCLCYDGQASDVDRSKTQKDRVLFDLFLAALFTVAVLNIKIKGPWIEMKKRLNYSVSVLA